MRAPLCSTPCCCGAVAGATARSSASTRAASPPMGPCCHPALRLTSRWAWRWLCRTSWAPPWSPSTGKPGPVRAVPGWGGEGIPTCSPTTSARRSLAITLPEPPGDPPGRPPDLTAWLYGLTETMLPGLLRQADPQHVIEYSLALITVLNEVGALGAPCSPGPVPGGPRRRSAVLLRPSPAPPPPLRGILAVRWASRCCQGCALALPCGRSRLSFSRLTCARSTSRPWPWPWSQNPGGSCGPRSARTSRRPWSPCGSTRWTTSSRSQPRWPSAR